MSLKYIDKNGASHIISGLTPGGNLETGAVATRKGTVTISTETVTQNESISENITFADAMPDANYLVSFSTDTSGHGENYCAYKAKNLTANGFTLQIIFNGLTGHTTEGMEVKWTAYKLYDVADAEQLYSTVQDLEAMVPANASSTNKFTTADDLRTETRTLDRRLDDVEDVVPTSASISNKLVTQSDLSGVEIDKVEDINDVELTNIQDGQTLIWDDTNSKWVNGQGGKIYTAGDGIDISGTDEISTNTDNTSVVIGNNKELKVANTYKTIFVGTRAQWDALSTADKVKYNEAHITDDVIGGEVADEVTDGLMSPVTSNAVFDALSLKQENLAFGVFEGDLNNVQDGSPGALNSNCTVWITPNTTHNPSPTDWGIAFTTTAASGLILQIVFYVSGPPKYRMYFNNDWGTWITFTVTT